MPDDRELLSRAAADMAQLAETTGEAASLAVLSGSHTVCVDAIGPVRLRAGERVPFWRRAIGMVLAAGAPPDTRRALLEGMERRQLAEAGFATSHALAAHFDLVRARGYAIEAADPAGAIAAVAAPVVDRRGFAVAAIALEGASERLPRHKLHAFAPALIEATRGASALAGGAPRPVSTSPRPATPPSPAVRPFVDARNLIGESPVYDAANERLFWIDMYEPAIFRLDRGRSEPVAFAPGEMVTALAVAPEGLLVTAQSGLWLFDPESGERTRALGHPERHIPTNRFNDAKRDSRGRLWINTIDLDFAAGAGALYRLDPDGEFAAVERGLTVPNGIGWSPDERTMYLADTGERAIYAYDFAAASGEIANRRELIRFAAGTPGAPDGLAIDRHGNLWVALFDGWRVSQFSPAGELLRDIVMPVPRPTSCAFGDDKTLFVTSARIRVAGAMLEAAPHSGALFEISL